MYIFLPLPGISDPNARFPHRLTVTAQHSMAQLHRHLQRLVIHGSVSIQQHSALLQLGIHLRPLKLHRADDMGIIGG